MRLLAMNSTMLRSSDKESDTDGGHVMLSNKTRIKRGHFNRRIYTGLGCVLFIFTLSVFVSCDNIPFEMISELEADEIKAVLNDRSFRQFDPHVDASPRRGVILDFL